LQRWAVWGAIEVGDGFVATVFLAGTLFSRFAASSMILGFMSYNQKNIKGLEDGKYDNYTDLVFYKNGYTRSSCDFQSKSLMQCSDML
jgi:hypothetical protein